MKILVQFSGGKDSQACLIWAVKKYGKENVVACFADTGWEHADTYTHIHDVCNQLGVELITLKSKKYKDFVDMSINKGRFPSSQRRFCTSELKVIPMIDYILSQDDSFIIIQGIRAKESKARAGYDVECSYFKEYFNDEVKGLYHKKAVLEWCKTHDASVLRPIFHWSAQEVIDYILANGQRPNPLYERGFSRVGCFPCIMCRKREVQLISKDKWAAQRLIDAEQRTKELLYVSFYLLYGIEWLIRLVMYKNARKAYRNISFEREAYDNQDNFGYIIDRERNPYNFIKYLKINQIKR